MLSGITFKGREYRGKVKVLFVWPNKDGFGFVDSTQSGESAKVFKPTDLSQYGL